MNLQLTRSVHLQYLSISDVSSAMRALEQDFEVRLESVQILKKIGTRQRTRPKPAATVFSRVVASGGTLELDLRENSTKNICLTRCRLCLTADLHGQCRITKGILHHPW